MQGPTQRSPAASTQSSSTWTPAAHPKGSRACSLEGYLEGQGLPMDCGRAALMKAARRVGNTRQSIRGIAISTCACHEQQTRTMCARMLRNLIRVHPLMLAAGLG